MDLKFLELSSISFAIEIFSGIFLKRGKGCQNCLNDGSGLVSGLPHLPFYGI